MPRHSHGTSGFVFLGRGLSKKLSHFLRIWSAVNLERALGAGSGKAVKGCRRSGAGIRSLPVHTREVNAPSPESSSTRSVSPLLIQADTPIMRPALHQPRIQQTSPVLDKETSLVFFRFSCRWSALWRNLRRPGRMAPERLVGSRDWHVHHDSNVPRRGAAIDVITMQGICRRVVVLHMGPKCPFCQDDTQAARRRKTGKYGKVENGIFRRGLARRAVESRERKRRQNTWDIREREWSRGIKDGVT